MTLNASGKRLDGSSPVHALDGSALACHFFGQSSFAAHALANERNVVRVVPGLPLEMLAPLGCGFQSGAGAVMRELRCGRGESILITGGGTLGLSAVMGAVLQGCRTIIVSEPFASRRELALELGATHVIDPLQEDLVRTVRSIEPDGVHHALDTTGRNDVIQAGLESLRIMGVMGVAAMEADPAGMISVRGSSLRRTANAMRGCYVGDSDPDTFIPQLIGLWQQGRFPMDKLIGTYPLKEINQAVSDQLAGRCVKAVLMIGDGELTN